MKRVRSISSHLSFSTFHHLYLLLKISISTICIWLLLFKWIHFTCLSNLVQWAREHTSCQVLHYLNSSRYSEIDCWVCFHVNNYLLLVKYPRFNLITFNLLRYQLTFHCWRWKFNRTYLKVDSTQDVYLDGRWRFQSFHQSRNLMPLLLSEFSSCFITLNIHRPHWNYFNDRTPLKKNFSHPCPCF